MPSPVAWVQGDDYNGGNPPLPAYVNTAAFEAWYGATNGSGGGYGGPTFRHEYEFTNGNGGVDDVDYFIDSTVKFNGHNTLRHLFGHDTVNHFGAYHSCDLTDDGDPTETYPPNASLNQPSINGASNYPNSYWMRTIFNGDAGFFPVGLSTTFTTGFEILGADVNNGIVQVSNRQGKIKLDTRSKQTFGSGTYTNITTDICDETVFYGRGDSLFGDLIVYYEGNEVNNTQTVKVWAGDACSLAGVSPLVNQTVPAFGFLDIVNIEQWNTFYTVASQPAKNMWCAGWKYVPAAIEANPWGVALT
jgi:hypothetical protein